MADAIHEDVLIPLDLAEVKERVKQKVDPAEQYTRASIETAMHAVPPHRVVLHVHCVNTIAWAVRQDAPVQLEHQLDGLRWQWISYVPSGLPLAREIEKVLSASADTDVLVLGNHGLVIGGDDCGAVEDLLSQVEQRLAICPRQADPTDYAALAEIVVRHGICQMTMKCMLLARTRFLERFCREAFSILSIDLFELEHAGAVPLGSLSRSQRPMGESILYTAFLDY